MSKRETNLRIVANFSKFFMVVCLVFQQLVLELLLLEYGYGTMGINYIFTGEANGISDMIDESIGTYELYEGIY